MTADFKAGGHRPPLQWEASECPADGKLEIVGRLMNTERYSRYGSEVSLIDATRIEGKIQPERGIDNRHDDLEFQPGAHSQTCIGSLQKLSWNHLDLSRRHDLTFQCRALQNPRISDVRKRNQGHHLADDRNAVLKIPDQLRIPSNIHNVIESPDYRLEGLWIDDLQISRYERNRTEGAEVESADIEVSADKEPVIER